MRATTPTPSPTPSPVLAAVLNPPLADGLEEGDAEGVWLPEVGVTEVLEGGGIELVPEAVEV